MVKNDTYLVNVIKLTRKEFNIDAKGNSGENTTACNLNIFSIQNTYVCNKKSISE